MGGMLWITLTKSFIPPSSTPTASDLDAKIVVEALGQITWHDGSNPVGHRSRGRQKTIIPRPTRGVIW